MNQIYRVSPDQERFGTLIFDGELLGEALGWEININFSGVQESIAAKWPECTGWFQSLYSDDILDSKPDVYLLENTVLVLSEKAKHLLEPVLRAAGEFLSFDADGEPYYLFMVHTILPVDESNSEQALEYGNMIGTHKLAFYINDVEMHAVFKTAFDNFFNLYCAVSFKDAVEQHQLQGLFFETELARVIE